MNYKFFVMSFLETIDQGLTKIKALEPVRRVVYLDDYQEVVESGFKKPWEKMTLIERTNRLMLYHKEMIHKYGLSEEAAKNLQYLFTEHVGHSLSIPNMVVYDVESERIVSIPKLRKETHSDIFFFEHLQNQKPHGVKLKIDLSTLFKKK